MFYTIYHIVYHTFNERIQLALFVVVTLRLSSEITLQYSMGLNTIYLTHRLFLILSTMKEEKLF